MLPKRRRKIDRMRKKTERETEITNSSRFEFKIINGKPMKERKKNRGRVNC